jgi:hypothetical protein
MFAAVIDFQNPVDSSAGPVFREFGRPGRWLTLPHALGVGRRIDGTPDFRIDLIRAREAASGELSGYGVVDFRVTPVTDLEAARQAVSNESVFEGAFGGGWVRLLIHEPDRADGTLALAPMRIASNGLGAVRLAAQLTLEGAVLLKRALLEEAVLVDVWAEMEVTGVSPRFPFVARLTAADLAAELAGLSRDGLVERAAVVHALTRTPMLADLPDGLLPFALAEAVADRLRLLVGTQVPSPASRLAEWWQLDLPQGDTEFRWDLTEEVLATRVVQFRFNPIALVRGAIAHGGLDALINENELSDVATGFTPLVVTANIPEVRTPVLSCGVDIIAEPAPPHRMHTIHEAVEFVPPADRGDLLLRLSPGEPKSYLIETFVIANLTSSVQEWRSPRRPATGDLRLTIDDFSARWLPVSATRQLLAEGSLLVTANWNGRTLTTTLTARQPRDTLVTPLDAGAVTEFSVELRGTNGVLRTPVTTRDLFFLDLTLFAEFGSHTVDISVAFEDDGPDVMALDLAPQSELESVLTLSFTRSRPTRVYTWYARSPFAPGYCYRLFQSGMPPRPWSSPQSAFASLQLAARQLREAAAV